MMILYLKKILVNVLMISETNNLIKQLLFPNYMNYTAFNN